MMELSEIESPIKEHRVAPSDSDTAYAASASTSPSASSKPNDWWAFIKANVPSILSILSVLTNVIILSALIPSMKQDIVFVQGQASSLQNSTSTLILATIGIQQQVSEASNNIQQFNSQFNQTQTDIIQLKTQTSQELDAKTASVMIAVNDTISTLDAQRLRLSAQINESLAQLSSIQQTFSQLQEALSQTVVQLKNSTDTSVSTLNSLNATFIASFIQSIAQLQDLSSTTSLAAVTNVRDTFVNNTVPQLTSDVRSLNQSVNTQLSAFISTFNSTLRSFYQIKRFLPTLTASGDSGTVSYDDLRGYVLQIGALYVYQFHLFGTITGSPSGRLQISLPQPNLNSNTDDNHPRIWSGTMVNSMLGGTVLSGRMSYITMTSTT